MRKYLRPILLALVALLLILFVAWWWVSRPDVARLSVEEVSGQVPHLSEVRPQIYPTMEIPPAVGWANGAKPVPAKGLKVQAFADGLDHPRWLYRLPNGDVLVAESNSPPRDVGGITGMVMGSMMKKAGAGTPSANRITLLRDTNNDGVADQKSVFLSGLNSPHGMVLVGDWLYVANTDALVRFPYKTGDAKITAKAEKIVDLPGGGNHWARNVIAAPGGKSLYVAIGSASNIAENDGLAKEGAAYTARTSAEQVRASHQIGRAMIVEVFPDTKRSNLFAWGLRNPNGMAIEPVTQTLWSVVNERDMLGSDMPPDYLAKIDLGAFFGWPWNYWGGYVDKRVSPGRPDLREYTKRPEYSLGPHTAPLGLAFANDAKLGGGFTSGAFVGLHGSWNRKPMSGYKVVFIPFGANGLPVRGAKPVDVLSGFLDKEEKAQGRPVAVITDASGALLVSDDVGNVIWRVSPAQ
ncbi:sorbosone dehydrogenase family protein [Sphingomonas sp. G-3-2-10]|uniref:PQQ-dependent sugar dehydrogenase n=1 Tax=Sphingomonas sp. G-3-2-10 TaxID=2728838 RepID=UPI00146CFC03|nr:sorbosone dehydrogenase family protein [Sphingomonas sp. G-3-2-10]NML06633.1 sorbosone dehydrogenase family protein [Sphingomonas sp. G-3-2-10]